MAADADIDALLADLYDLTGEDIGLKIGVLENTTSIRKPKPSKKSKKAEKDGGEAGAPRERVMQVAEYAMYNEFGTETIPARPAIRNTADTMGDEWRDALGNLLWGGTDAETALATVGQQATEDVQEAIQGWTKPPNKPSTIARKWKGEDNPLVDQGDYQDAIAYQIVRGSHDVGA